VQGATVNPFPPHTGLGGRFGLELTFTNDDMIEISRGEVIQEWLEIFESTFGKWLAEIQRIAPRARLSEITKDIWFAFVCGVLHSMSLKLLCFRNQSKVTVTLPLWCDELCSVPESPDQPHEEDVELYIHADDWVIEVGSSPLTIDQLSRHTHCFQRLLWDSAAAVGLFPHRRVGGGHLHLEFDSHFHGDATLLRNFIVDLCNRPLLFLGGLSLDLLNAPPLAILSPEQHQEFAKVIEEFDSLPAEQRTIPTLRHAIAKRVYTKSYVVANNFEMRYYVTHQDKYQAINVLHQHTIEIRGLHPQRSAESLLALMRLFESRISKVCVLLKLIALLFKLF
jgi:hypothetical protein